MIADFETSLLTGQPSLDFYRDDFRVDSCAFVWRGEDGAIKHIIRNNETAIRQFLLKCQQDGVTLGCHNYQFEWAVAKYRFPGLEDLFQIDTMRLAQMTDGGGQYEDEEEKTFEKRLQEIEFGKSKHGLSLEACCSRLLPPEYHNHKKPWTDLMEQRGGKKNSFNLLTAEELEAYNFRDSEVTLILCETLLKHFEDKGLDWKQDHELYKSTARLCALAKARGVNVDRRGLAAHLTSKRDEVIGKDAAFKERFSVEIRAIECEAQEALLATYKSARGRQVAETRLEQEPIEFNIKSTKQLQKLFCEKLGLKPTFTTKKDAPSFDAKFLFQWGEGGEMLEGRGKALFSIAQAEALLEMSEYDGKWHLDVRAAGARTGRLAGGSRE